MSTVTQWECDRCGRLSVVPVLNPDLPQGWFKFQQFAMATSPEFAYDFCDRCVADFQTWRKPR